MARRMRTSGPLDLRSQAILRAVIEEYVTTATPVGSQALVERYRLGVSSATVRAVLAENLLLKQQLIVSMANSKSLSSPA